MSEEMITEKQEKILEELVLNCGPCGYPKNIFFSALKSLNIVEQINDIPDLIDPLIELGFMSYKDPDHRNNQGLYKPKKMAYDYFGIT